MSTKRREAPTRAKQETADPTGVYLTKPASPDVDVLAVHLCEVAAILNQLTPDGGRQWLAHGHEWTVIERRLAAGIGHDFRLSDQENRRRAAAMRERIKNRGADHA